VSNFFLELALFVVFTTLARRRQTACLIAIIALRILRKTAGIRVKHQPESATSRTVLFVLVTPCTRFAGLEITAATIFSTGSGGRLRDGSCPCRRVSWSGGRYVTGTFSASCACVSVCVRAGNGQQGKVDLRCGLEFFHCRGTINGVGNGKRRIRCNHSAAHALRAEIDRGCLIEIPDCFGSSIRASQPRTYEVSVLPRNGSTGNVDHNKAGTGIGFHLDLLHFAVFEKVRILNVKNCHSLLIKIIDDEVEWCRLVGGLLDGVCRSFLQGSQKIRELS